MKKIVMLVLLTMCSWMANAQWSLTPEAGMTAYKRNGFMTDWKPGWKVGVGTEYRFSSEWFSLKSGLYYTQRGYSNKSSYPGPEGTNLVENYSREEMNNYFQLPVMANFSWALTEDVRLNLAVGPYVGWNMGGRSATSISISDRHDYGYGYGCGYGPEYGYGYGYEPTYANKLRAFDWGASAQLGLEVKQWVVNVAYEASLGKEYIQWSPTSKLGYHTISMSMGYKFKLGK